MATNRLEAVAQLGQSIWYDNIRRGLIASGDLLYDLAFLLMDLVERGLARPANIVFNRYLAATDRNEDLPALAALPLFLSVRAAIRAKVTAARLASARDRAPLETSARKYFALACRTIARKLPARMFFT